MANPMIHSKTLHFKKLSYIYYKIIYNDKMGFS